jgi:hypothetical protein
MHAPPCVVWFLLHFESMLSFYFSVSRLRRLRFSAPSVAVRRQDLRRRAMMRWAMGGPSSSTDAPSPRSSWRSPQPSPPPSDSPAATCRSVCCRRRSEKCRPFRSRRPNQVCEWMSRWVCRRVCGCVGNSLLLDTPQINKFIYLFTNYFDLLVMPFTFTDMEGSIDLQKKPSSILGRWLFMNGLHGQPPFALHP